jgi:DNA (cytosine-5)-methyltransferase 1
MRYLSVCSGIEAASVAWHHLGWEPVGFSEIEPFPAAVLKHRFPHVPNYGDMTKFEEWPIEPGTVDLLVGGTPCQSYSVAGLRQGLADPRGSLMLTYLAIAARLKPRWVVWENVPGVLSSNGGRDFGTFLGALGELGYGWAYRVLDAQYVRVGRWPRAVPQRRRRVFVVGRLIERGAGDWASAAKAVLIPEGLRRHNQASPKARKGVAPDAEGGARGGCPSVSPCLKARDYKGPSSDGDGDGAPLIAQPTDGTLGNRGLRSHTERDGHGAYIPVAQPVPYDPFQITAPVNRQNRKPGDPCHTLARDNAAHAAIAIGTDCYNGAITGDVAATMGTPGSSVNASGPTVMQAVAFKTGNSAKARSNAESSEVTPTLGSDAGGNTIPAVEFHPLQDPISSTDGSTHCMGTGGSQGHASIAVATAMTVRRLSAEECEALQGFSRGWTRIPWRGKPVEQCPDGPRYKALGNSMACNCMAWIGEKIAKWEADHA